MAENRLDANRGIGSPNVTGLSQQVHSVLVCFMSLLQQNLPENVCHYYYYYYYYIIIIIITIIIIIIIKLSLSSLSLSSLSLLLLLLLLLLLVGTLQKRD